MIDIEDNCIVNSQQYEDIKMFMSENHDLSNWNKYSLSFRRQFKYNASKSMFRHVYKNEHGDMNAPRELIKKAGRSQYGILNVCVFTSANPTYTDSNGEKQTQSFSCKHNCYYCPSEPGQPRSYLMKEPGVARANAYGFECVAQFHARLAQYESMGHALDKIEFEISGGTWSEYPREYQLEFIRDGYYAANSYKKTHRPAKTLEEEIVLNETADIHIIGLTIETRPDTVNLEELKLFRQYNVTRVQMGVQHTDNKLLKRINRGHTIETSMDAIRLLLNNGFKVDVHLMPMLPGATPEKDTEMFDIMLNDSRLQVDQWKVYPTSVVPWSVLQDWFNKGKYVPYSNEKLFDVLIEMKRKVHNRIRLIRIVRDINDEYILGGCSVPHMRQLLLKQMQDVCKCIRCRSAKTDNIDPNFKLKVDKFIASGSWEYFISYVSQDEKVLYGFCRLRLPNLQEPHLDEIEHCSLIRELHVYSTMVPVNGISKKSTIQHNGFGKSLLKIAEIISAYHGYSRFAVISGVGVRNYYKRHGYVLGNTYMIKKPSIIQLCMYYLYFIYYFHIIKTISLLLPNCNINPKMIR
jgi:ELP3 family radical SAM enzyme/protein acetyltransferase